MCKDEEGLTQQTGPRTQILDDLLTCMRDIKSPQSTNDEEVSYQELHRQLEDSKAENCAKDLLIDKLEQRVKELEDKLEHPKLPSRKRLCRRSAQNSFGKSSSTTQESRDLMVSLGFDMAVTDE